MVHLDLLVQFALLALLCTLVLWLPMPRRIAAGSQIGRSIADRLMRVLRSVRRAGPDQTETASEPSEAVIHPDTAQPIAALAEPLACPACGASLRFCPCCGMALSVATRPASPRRLRVSTWLRRRGVAVAAGWSWGTAPFRSAFVAAGDDLAAMPWWRAPAAAWVLRIALPIAVVLSACALRVINLSSVPLGFFCDEASNGLDAYHIGRGLHDQFGALLPAFFQAGGDWRGGFHIYFEVPFVWLFGPTVFADRVGSAVEGTLTIGLTYLFVSRAINKPVALIAALLIAVSPWHVLISRMGFEAASLPFATALSLVCLFYGLERPRVLALAYVCSALAIYTYQPAKMFIPLLVLAWSALYWPFIRRAGRVAFGGIAAAAVLLYPCIPAVFDGHFFARMNDYAGGSPSIGQRLSTFWTNYQIHLSPSWLIDQSTDVILRHYVFGYGMLYTFEWPLLLVGLATLVLRHRRADLLCLAWVAIYPVACAVVAPPQVNRSIDGVIVLHVAVAQGAWTCLVLGLALLRQLHVGSTLRAGLAVLALVIGLGGVCSASATFMHAYLVTYPRYSSGWWGWQWGMQQFLADYEAHRSRFDVLYYDGDQFNNSWELQDFFTVGDPAACATCSGLDIGYNAKTAIGSHYQPRQRALWVLTPDSYAASPLRNVPHQVVTTLRYPDGSPAWVYVATGPGFPTRSGEGWP